MVRFALALLTACLLAGPAAAQDGERRMSHCVAVVDYAPPERERIFRAGFRDPLEPYEVRISYVAHSMFLVQAASGVSVATDFTGSLGSADFYPDAVTMNHAHSSHWTPFVPPEIPHALRGWSGTFGEPAEHSLMVGDMLIRNVPTDIRSGGGIEPNGNSIFIFEVEGLCIGHLGHLHHEPDEAQYARIGRLDVVMVAVDGGLTLNTDAVVRVAKRLRASVVLPMHWFGRATLDRFVAEMSDEFAIRRDGASEIELSLQTLPKQPTVVVLEPRLLD